MIATLASAAQSMTATTSSRLPGVTVSSAATAGVLGDVLEPVGRVVDVIGADERGECASRIDAASAPVDAERGELADDRAGGELQQRFDVALDDEDGVVGHAVLERDAAAADRQRGRRAPGLDGDAAPATGCESRAKRRAALPRYEGTAWASRCTRRLASPGSGISMSGSAGCEPVEGAERAAHAEHRYGDREGDGDGGQLGQRPSADRAGACG